MRPSKGRNHAGALHLVTEFVGSIRKDAIRLASVVQDNNSIFLKMSSARDLHKAHIVLANAGKKMTLYVSSCVLQLVAGHRYNHNQLREIKLECVRLFQKAKK